MICTLGNNIYFPLSLFLITVGIKFFSLGQVYVVQVRLLCSGAGNK